MYCKHCGAEIKDTVNFCSRCGNKVLKNKNFNTIPLQDNNRSQEKQGSRVDKKSIVLIAVVSTCILCIIVVVALSIIGYVNQSQKRKLLNECTEVVQSAKTILSTAQYDPLNCYSTYSGDKVEIEPSGSLSAEACEEILRLAEVDGKIVWSWADNWEIIELSYINAKGNGIDYVKKESAPIEGVNNHPNYIFWDEKGIKSEDLLPENNNGFSANKPQNTNKKDIETISYSNKIRGFLSESNDEIMCDLGSYITASGDYGDRYIYNDAIYPGVRFWIDFQNIELDFISDYHVEVIDNIYSDDHLSDCMEKIGEFETYYREGVETGAGICYSYEKEEMLITLLFDDSSIDFSQFDMKIDQEKVRNDNPRLTHILICNNSDYTENYNLDLYRKEPFYALVCQSAKSSSVTENSIEMLINHGFDAHLVLTTDWSNLNQEPWYIVTAGYYNTQEEAQDNLLSVQKLFPDAYIKYSGSWKGNEKTMDIKQQPESLSSPINTYNDFSWSLSGNIINGGHAVFDGKDFYIADSVLYRLDAEGKKTTLYERQIDYMNECEDFLYFVIEESGTIHRMRKDGGELLSLNNKKAHELTHNNNMLYYVEETNSGANKICCMNMDGSDSIDLYYSDDEIWYMNVYKNRIYFTDLGKNRNIMSMNLDGSDLRLLNNEQCYDILVIDDFVYYSINNDTRYLCRMGLYGDNPVQLNSTCTKNINYKDNALYYRDENYNMHKCSLNGDNDYIVCSTGDVTFITLIPGKIFYRMKGAKTGLIEITA